jgi:hypothetical protein
MMKKWAPRLAMGLGLVFLLLLLTGYLWLGGPPTAGDGPLKVIHDQARDGVPEMMVVQKREGGPLPLFYMATLYVRQNDRDEWQGYYLQHDDSYWWRGKLEYERGAKSVLIRKNGLPFVDFYPGQNTIIHRHDKFPRTSHTTWLGNPMDEHTTRVYIDKSTESASNTTAQ